MEHLEVVDALPYPGELDGGAGHLPRRDGGATPGITVQFGEDQAGDIGLIQEPACHVDGILAGHRIQHEQHLVGVGHLADRRQFLHQVFIYLQPPRGVDDDRIEPVRTRPFDGRLDHPGSSRPPVRVHGYAYRSAQRLQLINGSRPLQVGGHQQRVLPRRCQATGQFGGCSRLAGALQADQQDGQRRLRG